METRLSAQQAYSIANDEYEKMMSNKVEELLDKIYKKIKTSSESGIFDACIDISIHTDTHRDRIAKVLECGGYKVRYDHRNCDNQDYVEVSWRNPT